MAVRWMIEPLKSSHAEQGRSPVSKHVGVVRPLLEPSSVETPLNAAPQGEGSVSEGLM